MVQNRRNIVRMGSIFVVLLFAFWLGFPIPPRTASTADIRKEEPNTADIQTVPPIAPSLTGDQLSIPILKDILDTLKHIDARIERLDARLERLDTRLERIERLIPAQPSR